MSIGSLVVVAVVVVAVVVVAVVVVVVPWWWWWWWWYGGVLPSRSSQTKARRSRLVSIVQPPREVGING